MVRGYHVYQDSWDAAVGEQLPPCKLKREPVNRKDLYAVAVVRPSAMCQRRYLSSVTTDDSNTKPTEYQPDVLST